MKLFLATIFTVLTLTLVSRDYTKCLVFQYEGQDSLRRQLVLEEAYDSAGRLIAFNYTGYKTSTAKQGTTTKGRHVYRDGLLILTGSETKSHSPSNVIYRYNEAGQKVSEEHRYLETIRTIKKNKGIKGPGGCIITARDYEEQLVWMRKYEFLFSYDQDGNEILTEVMSDNEDIPDRITRLYDEDNRVQEEKAYSGAIPVWSKAFTYFPGGYRFIQTWHNHPDVSTYLKKPSSEPGHGLQVNTYLLDQSGRVLEEIVSTAQGEQLSRTVRAYDASGRLDRVSRFNHEDQLDITHLYEYR